ncbi:transposase [Pseudomonas sp. R5(2019)]|uniref:REP-associated tyrosine transposase n=1 Tax=Pseudomonas sp. R5(2019) TaxID=2697566 RepID=UPI001411FCF3|nr:transposase [Pseudomonas sp. R5(2019)]NBA98620.1 transposase [Pseudomonas sp. R5(2019)]
MHASRLRTGRYSETGRVYFVTTTTERRTPIFTDFALGRLVVSQFRTAQEQGRAESLAWVVMPDHFHWLLSLESGSLSDLVGKVKACSARAINAKRRINGAVWQHGFHDRAVRAEEDLLAIARYVVANPLRGKLVERLGDYPLWDAVWI